MTWNIDSMSEVTLCPFLIIICTPTAKSQPLRVPVQRRVVLSGSCLSSPSPSQPRAASAGRQSFRLVVGVTLLVHNLRDTRLKSSIHLTTGMVCIFPYFLFKQWCSTWAFKRTWELLKLPLIPKPYPRIITWEFLGWDAGSSCLKLSRWF